MANLHGAVAVILDSLNLDFPSTHLHAGGTCDVLEWFVEHLDEETVVASGWVVVESRRATKEPRAGKVTADLGRSRRPAPRE